MPCRLGRFYRRRRRMNTRTSKIATATKPAISFVVTVIIASTSVGQRPHSARPGAQPKRLTCERFNAYGGIGPAAIKACACSTNRALSRLLKFKNPAAPAVKREAEEDWSRGRRRWQRVLTSPSASMPGHLTAKALSSTSPGVEDYEVAVATYHAAVKRWPGTPITLPGRVPE
jgi:hypothetical protein